MATSMVRMPLGGQSFLFTVSKATGSKFSQQNYTSPKFKNFSTMKDSMSLVDIQQNMFTRQDGGSTVTQRAINYIFPSFQPYTLPKEVMKLFGFNPENAVECPILTPPSIDQLEQLVSVACPVEGAIYPGVVNLGKYGTGDSHFYVVFAYPGNIHKIASRTGVPLSVLRNSLTSPLGVLAQWAGNMMAGGGTIQLDKEGERLLQQMAREQMERQNVVIGTGDLTVGRDQVELSRPERIMSGGATMFSFLARTKYFHALSGSVLHMQHVSASGNICWAWVGAGGKGFNSREVNNLTAIDLNLGMWPDMAKSIRTFYDNPDLMKLFVTGDPEDYQKLISLLVSASQEQRGAILDILQRAQVSMGFGARFKGILTHGAQQVPGDK
jgi:hypothetical protein